MRNITKNQQKKIGSLIITAILIGLIFVVLLPPSTAVLLEPGTPPVEDVEFGANVTFQDVSITIKGGERIPVTTLNFSIYNNVTSDVTAFVEFSVGGVETSDPSNSFDINCKTSIQNDWYDYGYGYGYDDHSGPGISFGYGYGYGPMDLSDITVYYDITYSANETGDFYSIFSANCMSDEQTYTYTSIQSSVFTVLGVNLSLVEGWNLITIPLQNSWNASDVASNITGCQMVSWFDTDNQSYRTHITNVSAYDFQIQNGYGLFVYVNQTESSLYVPGVEITSVSVPLSVGWDMIGWYNYNDTTASSVYENITGCSIVSIFNTTSDTFSDLTSPGVANPPWVISRGDGLFVYVNQSSIWMGIG